MGAVFDPTRFSLVRISIRDLVADGKSLLRNSGVGGGGANLILMIGALLSHPPQTPERAYLDHLFAFFHKPEAHKFVSRGPKQVH